MSDALSLESLGDGLAALTFDTPGRSVNVFTRGVLAELERRIEELAARDDIRCLVLKSGKGGNFIAGADVEEIARVTDPVEAEAASRQGQRLFSAWESLPFPTVAAVHATCVGGGTELALACDHVLVADDPGLRIGLPEIRLGILPGWGGCVRLPERVDLPDALDVILAGKTVSARTALRIGLADARMPAAAFGRLVRRYAAAVARGEDPGRERDGAVRRALLEKNPIGRKIVFDKARSRVLERTRGHYPAPLRALEVVRVGVERGRQAGFDAEARAVGELAISPVCKSLMHVFRLTETVKRSHAGDAAVRAAGVLGAGTMGGGIAQLFSHELSVPVRLKDIDTHALAQGMEHAAGLFDKLVEKRRLTRPRALEKMALLRPSLVYDGFAALDVVVEAIVEKLPVKQAVMAEVSRLVPAGAVLATNTSSLSIDEIARDVVGPERVVGMHFFNPVHKMPLVEVVRGERTSSKVVDFVTALCHRLGKTPVVVADGPGFLVNRLLMFSLGEALHLLEEGVPIETLDETMKGWGMPMGPVELTDEVGIDVAVHVAGVVAEAFADRLAIPGWLGRMVEDGRLGAKAGRGFYRYDGRERKGPDGSVYGLLGLEPAAGETDPTRLTDRVVLPMVNEAARCLAEGIAASAADVDLAMIMGTGFPPFRGGLCRWADREGTEKLATAMRELAERVGQRYAPSEAFEAVAEAGGFYAAHPAEPDPRA